jgi:hypothetical protein
MLFDCGVSRGHSAKMSFYSRILYAKFFNCGVSLSTSNFGYSGANSDECFLLKNKKNCIEPASHDTCNM